MHGSKAARGNSNADSVFSPHPRRSLGNIRTNMIPLYLLSLGGAGAVVGAYVRRLLAAAGYVPNFEAGLLVAGAIAAAFIAAQLVYTGVLRATIPSRSPAYYFFEALANAGALALAPPLAGVSLVDLGAARVASLVLGNAERAARAIEKVEPLLFLAAFVAVLAFFKLLALYATLRSRPASRLASLAWLGLAMVPALAGLIASYAWRIELIKAQRAAPGEVGMYRIGDTFAPARRLREGAHFTFPVSRRLGQNVTLRWASAVDESKPPDRIHIAYQFDEAEASLEMQELPLRQGQWNEWKLPSVNIPENATACTLLWTSERTSPWVLRSGLRPSGAEGKTMLVSGPYFHESRAVTTDPNLIVLFIEGLGAEHVSGLGYTRATTPSLQRIAANGIVFSHAYTPAPEPLAAAMSLLTGVNPLRHGHLGAMRGPLPDGMRTLTELLHEDHYATAAFTEGDGPDDQDLVHGSDFDRGFELFDPYYPVSVVWRRSTQGGANPVAPAGSSVTLEKAARWIEMHSDEKFMVFIRLRELRHPQWLRSRYGDGFVTSPAAPRPLDVYDTALASVDKQIGAFYDRLRMAPGLENTCFVVTSPYGFDFSASWNAPPKRDITEPCLRVPVILGLPQRPRHLLAEQHGLVMFEDVAATVASLANVRFEHAVSGADLLRGEVNREPISLAGVPLALSIRTSQWRFTWQSGLEPFTWNRVTEAAPVVLVNIEWYLQNWKQGDQLARQPTLVEHLTGRLASFVNENAAARKNDLQRMEPHGAADSIAAHAS